LQDHINHKSVLSFTSSDIDFELTQETKIQNWLVQVATNETRSLSHIEYIFCSDNYLLDINVEYLNHDYYTDIITFPLQESPLEATIFISIERVRENAQLYNSSFEDELHRVLVHGLLHLLGYKDSTADEKLQMRNKENDCLAKRSFI